MERQYLKRVIPEARRAIGNPFCSGDITDWVPALRG